MNALCRFKMSDERFMSFYYAGTCSKMTLPGLGECKMHRFGDLSKIYRSDHYRIEYCRSLGKPQKLQKVDVCLLLCTSAPPSNLMAIVSVVSNPFWQQFFTHLSSSHGLMMLPVPLPFP